MACEVYKIVNDLSPKYINDLVNIENSSYNFSSEKKAEVPKVNSTGYGLRSFRSEAPQIWNSLPNDLRVAESYLQFRRMSVPSLLYLVLFFNILKYLYVCYPLNCYVYMLQFFMLSTLIFRL